MFLTIIFAALGYFFARLPGLLVGATIGILVDAHSKKGEPALETIPGKDEAGNEDSNTGARVQTELFYSEDEERFFSSCFPLFAKLARVDGPVNKSEIVAVDHIMRDILMLDDASRKKAIHIFKESKSDSKSFGYYLRIFHEQYAGRTAILRANTLKLEQGIMRGRTLRSKLPTLEPRLKFWIVLRTTLLRQ